MDPKHLQSLLSYYVFMAIDMPPDFQVNLSKLYPNANIPQDKEYLTNLKTITWVKSLKDVYQKFVQTSLNPKSVEEMAMPYFYIKAGSFHAVFRVEEG